jgi:hypothetical protein
MNTNFFLEGIGLVAIGLADQSLPFYSGLSEIDEEADRELGGFEIIEADRSEFLGQAFGGFELEEDFPLNNEIGHIISDFLFFIEDGEGLLLLDEQAGLS